MNPLPQATSTAPEDIRDIRGLVEIASGLDLLPWAALGVAALLAIALLARWLRRPPAPRPAPSPEVVALAALERARQWMRPDLAERFGTAVSAAVRDYVEARFEVSAPRRTTEEFLRHLARFPVADLTVHVGRLDEILRRMDLVKFAREPLDEPQMQGLIDSARDFVRQTRPAGPEAKS